MEGESPKPTSTPRGAVFVSYASQDAEAALRICEALRAADVEVWLDQSELRGGDAWDQAIRKQIKACALFIPVISATAHSRVEGYFRLEWKLAVDRSHLIAPDQAFLLPVVIDDTPQTDERIPDRFRELQWSRLPGGQATPAFVERVRRLLSPEPTHGFTTSTTLPSASGLSAPKPKRSTRTSWRSKPALLVISVLLALGLAYFVVDKVWLPERIASSRGTTTASARYGSPAMPEKSIAVLPFVDLSEKHDQEYFADGMAEEILNLLVKVPDLKVIGRTSSFQFKGKTEDLRRIGAALGAVYVVEGSVRRSGNHVRVTAQLVDTRDGMHRWSETYDREASDVLQVQDEISASLVRALQVEVADSGRFQTRSALTNREAYDAYLRGIHAFERRDPSGFEEAVAELRRSLELDQAYAPAAEALAVVFRNQAYFGFVPPKVGYEQARAAAATVLKLNSQSGIAHAVLLAVHTEYDWDWAAAERELHSAVALAPNNATVLLYAAEERLAVGELTEAMQFLDSAGAVDPLYPEIFFDRSLVYLRLSRFEEAAKALRRITEISPTAAWVHYNLGIVLLVEGRADAALEEMQKEGPATGQLAGLAVAYYSLNRTKEAEEALGRLEAQNSGDSAMAIAEAYAYRERKGTALQWLDKAYEQKDIGLYSIKGDPLLKNLEADSRYKAFLRKMNLPE